MTRVVNGYKAPVIKNRPMDQNFKRGGKRATALGIGQLPGVFLWLGHAPAEGAFFGGSFLQVWAAQGGQGHCLKGENLLLALQIPHPAQDLWRSHTKSR